MKERQDVLQADGTETLWEDNIKMYLREIESENMNWSLSGLR
jgi:hypothetical protein